MAPHPTPEDAIVNTTDPPLRMSLSCSACDKKSKISCDWVCVHPDLERCKADGWDGIILSRIFTCAGCGAVDEYELATHSRMMLTGSLLRALSGTDGRVFIATMELWDGSQARRPSQTLAHLRRLAREQPTRPEAHWRLGNACDRLGLVEEAEAAWRRALAIDPDDIQAGASLADFLLQREARAPEGQSLLLRCVEVAPSAAFRDEATRRHATMVLFSVIRRLAMNDEPIALEACWAGGKAPNGAPMVDVSSVDLRRVLPVWDRLIDFIVSAPSLRMRLSLRLPAEVPTRLEAMLTGAPIPEGVTFFPNAITQPVRVARRVGRNEACPCGSGEKSKRCCAGKSADPAVEPGAADQAPPAATRSSALTSRRALR